MRQGLAPLTLMGQYLFHLAEMEIHSVSIWRRTESDNHFQGQPPPQRTLSNGIRITDPNSLGILGAGPSDKRFASEKPYRTQPGGFPSRQGFSSGIK